MKNFVRLTAATLLLAHSNVSAGTLFVCAGCANPVPPFANWATAATNIQQALDAAAAGAEVVVTNGIYGAVNVDKPLLLRSVNGPRTAKPLRLPDQRDEPGRLLVEARSSRRFWGRRVLRFLRRVSHQLCDYGQQCLHER